jgi:hypothetical protein
MKWLPIARAFVTFTLLVGAFAHLNNLIFGPAVLATQVMTPIVDSLFVFPMAIGAYSAFRARREIAYRNRFEKGIVLFTAVYFTLSLPIHIRTWFTQDTTFIEAFPVWYSGVFLVYTTIMQIVWYNLRAKPDSATAAITYNGDELAHS